MAKTIVIFRTGQLGDTLVAMPAIYAIRKQYPKHRLVLLTDRHPGKQSLVSSWEVLGKTGWFDDVIFYIPGKDLWNLLKTISSLVKKLRSFSPDYIFNLSPPRNAWQTLRDWFFFKCLVGVRCYRASGVCLKLGKGNKGFLMPVEPEWSRLLRVARLEAEKSIFRLPIPDNERERVKQILEEEGIAKGAVLLAVGPGSNRSTTKWPMEHFAELGKRLLEKLPLLELLVLGGNGDRKIGDELCTVWGKRSHNFAGKLSIYGSASAIDHCRVFVGNDTGNLHLAAMVGKPCVGLFSARNYLGEWEPYGKNHIILRKETECAGCELEVCNEYNNKCLNQITVDEVFEAVNRFLVRGET